MGNQKYRYSLKTLLRFLTMSIYIGLLSNCASTSVYRMVRDDSGLYAPLYIPAMVSDIVTFPVQYWTGLYWAGACFTDAADDSPFCFIDP